MKKQTELLLKMRKQNAFYGGFGGLFLNCKNF